MRRHRALSFALLAFLGGCSSGSGATPTPAGLVATAVPTVGPIATVLPTVIAPTTAPATPPPGLTGRLVFNRFNESIHTFTGMFRTAADGSGEVEVPMPWEEGGGRWSTAGDLIAIPTQLADGRIGTAILDDLGKVLRVLEIASPGLNLACTTWSPDDKRLACEAWDDSDPTRGGVYTVRSSDGGDIKRITTPPAGKADDAGDWSSDGTIVFKRYAGDEGPGPLFVVDADGGEATQVIADFQEDSGAFSPDGKLIATSSGGVIRVYDLAGKQVSRFERPKFFLFGPSWSPDGKWLVFSVTQNGQFRADLYIARPDGADLYQVTSTAENEIVVDWGADPGP